MIIHQSIKHGLTYIDRHGLSFREGGHYGLNFHVTWSRPRFFYFAVWLPWRKEFWRRHSTVA